MTEDKIRRMVTGIVVAATALIVTLLIILSSNIVTMCVQNNRMQELADERVRLEQLIDEGREDVDYYKSDLGIDQLLFEQGFVDANKK